MTRRGNRKRRRGQLSDLQNCGGSGRGANRQPAVFSLGRHSSNTRGVTCRETALSCRQTIAPLRARSRSRCRRCVGRARIKVWRHRVPECDTLPAPARPAGQRPCEFPVGGAQTGYCGPRQIFERLLRRGKIREEFLCRSAPAVGMRVGMVADVLASFDDAPRQRGPAPGIATDEEMRGGDVVLLQDIEKGGASPRGAARRRR